MIVEIYGKDASEAYYEALYKMRAFARYENSRAGRVLSIPYITVLTIEDPRKRVVFCPQRNANPFFHIAEFIWMMAGSNKVSFLLPFNKRMAEFADDGLINGAYGYRWTQNQQIKAVIHKLRSMPETRQAVLSMWDSAHDNVLGLHDYPCNTHIYFRMVNGKLNMTVCNRSNDLIWGMLGANVVHMTLLHELISCATEIPLGKYQVVTNNLHMYERHWELLDASTHYNPYRGGDREHMPVVKSNKEVDNTFAFSYHYVNKSKTSLPPTEWQEYFAIPFIEYYLREKDQPGKYLFECPMQWDFQLAGNEYMRRRQEKLNG